MSANPAKVATDDYSADDANAPDIVLTVRQEIGRIKSTPYGNDRMVVAAFKMAGSYLDNLASGWHEETTNSAEVEFQYESVRFVARASIG